MENKQNYLTLQSFLKLSGYIDTGGQSKLFLFENEVLVNGEKETRRGRKLFPNDIVKVFDKEYRIK